MKLQQDALGRVTKDYPAVWFRVSTWATERFVADFTTQAEAEKFAVEDAKGLRYDHKVSKMRLSA